MLYLNALSSAETDFDAEWLMRRCLIPDRIRNLIVLFRMEHRDQGISFRINRLVDRRDDQGVDFLHVHLIQIG